MAIYVISELQSKDLGVGVRIIDSDTMSVADLGYDKLKELLSSGKSIANIELDCGSIKWSSGIKDRYPVIDISDWKLSHNNTSITVIMKNKVYGGTMYTVANGVGDIANISESKLIQYGKEYTISNCKIVIKDGKAHISAIKGTIPELIGEVNYSYDSDKYEVTVSILGSNITDIDIPKEINGELVTGLRGIKCVPEYKAKAVKRLRIPKTVDRLGTTVYGDFINLDTIILDANMKYMNPFTFGKACMITKVYIRSVDNNTSGTFNKLTHLKSVGYKTKPLVIQSEAYKDTKVDEFNQLLYEGIVYIGERAYGGLPSVTEVSLPSTLKVISTTAFDGCENIAKVILNGIVNFEREKNKELAESTKFLSSSPNAILHCPYDYPIDSLIKYVDERVKIVRMEQSDEGKELANKVKKAKLLGLKVRTNGVAENYDEVLGFLSIISDKQWKNKMEDIIKAYTTSNNKRLVYIVSNCGASINVTVDNTGVYEGTKATRYVVGKRYAYIEYKSKAVVILIGREELKDEQTKIKAEDIRQKSIDTPFMVNPILKNNSGSRYIVNLKTVTVSKGKTGVRNVYEEGDSLVIERGNKSIDRITI